METKMQLQRNANVIAAYGQPVGYLDRVVLDPKSRVITDIVIQTGTPFNREDRVVPIAFVADTDEGEILLREEADELESFPPFEEEQIVDAPEDGDVRPDEDMPPAAFGSPTFGIPWQPAVGEKISTRVNQNIPQGTVAMKEGAKVMSADGKHVGNVERIFSETSRQQITHLLISQGGVFHRTRKRIPNFWVKDMNEEQVDLKVEKVAVDALEDRSDKDAVE